MVRIAIIVGSTRPGRRSRAVAEWVQAEAGRRSGVTVDLLDLAEVELPFLDEPQPPAAGDYQQPHTRAWADTIRRYDGFVIVTPEYNRSIPAVLKNALDLVFAEWQGKAAGLVGYGMGGGRAAVAHLGTVAEALGLAVVEPTVTLSVRDDFADGGPAPAEEGVAALTELLDAVFTAGRLEVVG